MSLDTHQSVYREKLIEHLFMGEMLKLSWLKHDASLEVSYPAIDRSGHDIVLEVAGIVRHIQLKTSATSAVATSQKVHLGLGDKPSGCVIWIQFDRETMSLGPFLFFGGLPGQPLPHLDGYKTATHTKANSEGIKAERPHLRLIPRAHFRKVDSIDALYLELFGKH
ncbi:hypothetical protein ACK8QS_11735 [Ectopseudomonas mendocina]